MKVPSEAMRKSHRVSLELWERPEEGKVATLTVCLDHFGPARAAEDHGASSLFHGNVGIFIILLPVSDDNFDATMTEKTLRYTGRKHTACRCWCPSSHDES